MKKRFLIPVLAAIVILMSACSTNTDNGDKTPTPDSSPTENTSTATFPITIKHAFGETIIKEKPMRVVTISWGNQDTPLALGVTPVGISETNYGALPGDNLLIWTKEKLAALGGGESTIVFNDTDGLDFEAINEAKPDVILAAYSGISEEDYKTLSAIAPVVAYPQNPWQTPWRDQIKINAEAMGLKTEGEKLVSELETLIAEKVAAHPELANKTAAFMYFNPADLSTISIYTSGDPRAAFLEDLGFGVAPSVIELAKDAETFYLSVSSENADKLNDVDIILTWASGDGSDLLGELQKHPLIGTIPAIQNGAIIMFSESPLAAAQTPSALSIPYTIDDYLDEISKAAQKIK